MRLWDPLAVRELSALLRDPVFRGRGVPRGDGRPVLLIPGFLSGDWALRILHGWLGRVGYQSHLSGIVLNVQHSERMISGLGRTVSRIATASGSRISVVGHSRGGLLAKVLSQRKPDDVEQVIALGAPLADWTDLAAVTHHAVGVVRGRELARALRRQPLVLCEQVDVPVRGPLRESHRQPQPAGGRPRR